MYSNFLNSGNIFILYVLGIFLIRKQNKKHEILIKVRKATESSQIRFLLLLFILKDLNALN